jgi:predicted DNA-binding ribbon-helix-helix protein
MQKRSVNISGHQTSISLEEEFWQALKTIAQTKKMSLAGLIREIDSMGSTEKRPNLSSRIRIYVLGYYMNKQEIQKL